MTTAYTHHTPLTVKVTNIHKQAADKTATAQQLKAREPFSESVRAISSARL